mmetsp:Transcript_74447/g.215813  ORF Transcript_74447/g.215813 Transcript_74447/m.215813 type:complete len:204 (-) Transcript_74447:4102-4713(-)
MPVALEHNLRRRRGLENAAASVHVREHLHLLGVDLRIQYHPSATAQLAAGGDVDRHGMLVLHQSVDDHGAVLEHLREHVAGTTRKATPVREDDQRQVLAAIEVADRLRSLVGRVRVPDLARLWLVDVVRSTVRRISNDVPLDGPRLHRHNADGKAAQTATTDDHSLAPTFHVLLKGALVTEARLVVTIHVYAGEHMPGVVWRL